MNARTNPSLPLMLGLLVACGNGTRGDPADDASVVAFDAAPLDGSEDTSQTSVEGVLDGSSFQLTYAAVAFGEPLTTVCAATVPIVAPDCGLQDDVEKFVFRGMFGFNDSGAPQWGLGGTQIHRVGVTGEIARAGTIDVMNYDEAAGTVQLSFSVEFTSGTTSGHIGVAE